MASVYILYSPTLDSYYTGSCDDLKSRLDKHYNKEFEKSYTAKSKDWELFFSINDLAYEQARKIETHIKKMKSKTYILNLKKYPEIAEKLIMKYR